MISTCIALVGLSLLLAPEASVRRRVLRAVPAGRTRRAAPGIPHRRVLGVVAGGALGAVVLSVGTAGVVAVLAAGTCAVLVRRARRRQEGTGPMDLASGYELFAAALRAGLSVPAALSAVTREFAGPAQRALGSVADRIALGADTAEAWEPALRCRDTVEIARAARRTARTGSPLAVVVTELAERTRARAHDREHARARRAAVWVSAPLGLCFLPSFFCLGIAPTVLGMIQRVGEL
ncbi:type II secretion system F family protein [Bounagaea algeriensis]